MIYFDNAATTPFRKGALDILNQALLHDFANPSSSHKLGQELFSQEKACIKELSSKILGKLDCISVVTSGATESNNQVIFSLAKNRPGIVYCSKSEHPSLLAVLKHYQFEVEDIPLRKDGYIDYSKWKENFNSQSTGVFLSLVNGLNGIVHNLEELESFLEANANKKIHLHLDASQSLGKAAQLKPTMTSWSLTLSGHKFGGPKGIGILFASKDFLVPFIVGGGQQEGLRSGTHNWPALKSFQVAAYECLEKSNLEFENYQSMYQIIKEGLDGVSGVEILFPHSHPSFMLLLCHNYPSDVVMRHLEEKGIYVSTSSACSSRIKGKNDAFLALGIPEKWHKNILRISFGHQNTLNEASQFISEFKKIFHELKTLFGR